MEARRGGGGLFGDMSPCRGMDTAHWTITLFPKRADDAVKVKRAKCVYVFGTRTDYSVAVNIVHNMHQR